MTSVASKTDHQIHKNCTEQDPNESYAGARTDPSEKIFAHTPKNEPSLHSSRFYQIYDYDDISWCWCRPKWPCELQLLHHLPMPGQHVLQIGHDWILSKWSPGCKTSSMLLLSVKMEKEFETHKAMRAPCSARGDRGGWMRQARFKRLSWRPRFLKQGGDQKSQFFWNAILSKIDHIWDKVLTKSIRRGPTTRRFAFCPLGTRQEMRCQIVAVSLAV